MGDLLPDEWIEVFEPMCNMAPTSPTKAVRQVVEEELGRPIEEVFSSFSEKPIASASLAQVHKAILKSTGEVVAVKVQHP